MVVRRHFHVIAVFRAQIIVVMLHAHHFVTLKFDGLRRSQDVFPNDATETVVVVEHKIRFFVIVGEIGRSQLPASPLVRKNLLNQQHWPRTRPPTVFVRVAMQEIKQFVEHFIAGDRHALHQFVRRNAVDGENVDVDACHVVAVASFDERRAAIDNFAETARKRRARLDAQRLQRLRKPFVSVRHEAVVVGSGHTNVHVIVPRYETLVAHGSEHGASPAIIADAMLAADAVNRQHDFQNVGMEHVNVVGGHGDLLFDDLTIYYLQISMQNYKKKAFDSNFLAFNSPLFTFFVTFAA